MCCFLIEGSKVISYPKDLYVIKTGRNILVETEKTDEKPKEYFYPSYFPFVYEKGEKAPYIELRAERNEFTETVRITKGYHAYYEFDTFQRHLVLGVFKIPANAKFYKNKYGEIVSPTLVYVGKLNEETIGEMAEGQVKVKIERDNEGDARLTFLNETIKEL